LEHYLYLFLDLGALILPFLFSFHKRIRFDRQWPAFWPGVVIVAFVFIVWDIAFTRMGVWGFNARYLTGLDLLGLPVEEWLFFLCIPYACVFTYFVLGALRSDPWAPKVTKVISWVLIGISLCIGMFHFGRWYTSTTFLALATTLTTLFVSGRIDSLGRFFVSYAVVLLPFFLINGTLTGSFIEGEVVWYNDAENLGIRLGTIPIEDIFYGMLLILLNVVLFERWRKIQ